MIDARDRAILNAGWVEVSEGTRLTDEEFERVIEAIVEIKDPPLPIDYRICTKCAIHHYENCDTCLGWGVYAEPTIDGLIPVIANDAHTKKFRRATTPCHECGSTPEGLPKDARATP